MRKKTYRRQTTIKNITMNNLHIVSSKTFKPVSIHKTAANIENRIVETLQDVSGIHHVLFYKNEYYIIFDLFFNSHYNYKISNILTVFKAVPNYKLKTLCITAKTQKISIELELKD